jgi:ryanodine receptor 2
LIPVILRKYLFHVGGRNTVVIQEAIEPYIRKGDVIGCALDLTVPVITFTFNGHIVKGSFRNFNLDGMFFPVISCSSKLRYGVLTVCNKTS